MTVTLAPEDQAVLLLYFAAVLAIGFLVRRRRGGAVEFLLAGRSLTLPVFVMTLVSTWYGGILGVGEFTYLHGISSWFLQGVPYYLFALLFALLMAGRVRSAGLTTIPDKLDEAYGRPAALAGAGLTFLLTTPAPYALMIGVLLQTVTGWPLAVCVLAGTAATTIYLWRGGFRADLATDVFEFGVMFLGFAVIIPFAWEAVGAPGALPALLPPGHLVWHGGHTPQHIAVWFLIALWTLIDPSFHQRCSAAATPAVARNGILLSIPFWFLFDMMTALAGLYARAALPVLGNPVMAYPLLAEAVLPPVAKGVFFAGMLATIMSTLNTAAFVSAASLGRDLIGRMRNEGEVRAKRLTQWGLVATGTISVALCLTVPSVVRLWYAIGSVAVPGLLVPLVTAYFPRYALPGRLVPPLMMVATGTSALWLAAGWGDEWPLGIEPMLPGLGVSILIWAVGLWGVRGGPGRQPAKPR